jgi:hypothetical protein
VFLGPTYLGTDKTLQDCLAGVCTDRPLKCQGSFTLEISDMDKVTATHGILHRLTPPISPTDEAVLHSTTIAIVLGVQVLLVGLF